jgi:tetratricopeptide (TPR) repeat protein
VRTRPPALAGLALAEQFHLEEEAVLALGPRGASRFDLGDIHGIDDLRQALRRSLQVDLGHATANAYNNLAYYLWSTDGPAVALEIHEEALEFCERRGIEDLGQYIKAGGLDYLFELGRWDELLSLSDELLVWSAAHGARQSGGRGSCQQGRRLGTSR